MYRYLFIFVLIANGHFAFAEKEDPSKKKNPIDKGEVTIDPMSAEEWEKVNKEYHPENISEEHVEAIKALLIRDQMYDEALVNSLKPRHEKLVTGQLWNQQIKGFPLEALVFYAAIGATMWRKATTEAFLIGEDPYSVTNRLLRHWSGSFIGGRQDPRWLENFTHELTSPVGVFSFFCFVLASGTTSHLYSKLTRGMVPWAEAKLSSRRLKYMFAPSLSTKIKYRRTRLGLRTVGAFSGQLGMAFGMLASDIVHELHEKYSYSPNAERCADELMKSEDSHLACNLMWDDVGQTAVAFLPGLASLITASMFSHALVAGVYTVLKRTGLSTVINSVLVPRAAIKFAGTVSWKAVAGAAIWLMPGGTYFKVGRGAVKTRRVSRFLGKVTKKIAERRLGFRFVNLYAFMETEQLVMHYLWNYLWGEPIKANAVAKSMKGFLKHHDVKRNTPFRECAEPEEGEDCEYHSSIFDIHKVSNRFNQWRQYKLQEASMAHQNWFLYVSHAIGSFDLAYSVYRNLFLARKNSAHVFNEIKYFGGVEEEKAQAVFSKMLEKIDQHIEVNAMKEPEILNFDVVSASPSRFLKPVRELNIREKDRLFVLRALFQAKDRNVPLQSFYGSDWEEVFQSNRAKILNSHMNPNKLVKDYFEYLEKGLILLKEKLNSAQRDFDSLDKQLLINLKKGFKLKDVTDVRIKHYRFFLVNKYFGNMQMKAIESLRRSERSVLDSKFKLPDESHFVSLLKLASEGLKQEFNDKSDEQAFLTWYFNGWINIISVIAAFANDDDNLVSDAAIQGWLDINWNKIIQNTKTEVLPLPLDYHKIDNLLRKKVLAAGVKYLNHIVKSEKKSRRGRIGYDSYYKIKEEEENGIKFPVDVKNVFRKIGMDNIFARLYQLTFIKQNNNEYIQISPKSRGMNVVEATNTRYKLRGESNSVEYNSSVLGFLHTPRVVDFLVASVLCGSDLRDEKHEDLLQQIKNVNSGQSSIEGTFAVNSGLSGKLKDVGQGILDGKLLLLQALEKNFPGLEMDDIVDQIPVFDRAIKGKSYTFYPPRIDIGIDENIRKAICLGGYSQTAHAHGLVGNIYDDRFPTKTKKTSLFSWPFEFSVSKSSPDKEYSNLLHLVLDHIGSGEISSVEEFDKWWFENVEPYQQIFLLAADREYKRIVERSFMVPLFQDEVKAVEMESVDEVKPDECGYEFASTWDNMSIFSKDWFTLEAIYSHPVNLYGKGRGYGTKTRSDESPLSCIKTYSAGLPRGGFQNMYFELHYWADIILYFGKKRMAAFKKYPDKQFHGTVNIENLKKHLRDFIEKFKTDECLSTEEALENKEQVQVCLQWGKRFLNPENSIALNALFRNIMKDLYISKESLFVKHNPFSKENSGDPMTSLSEEEIKKKLRESFAFFAKNTDHSKEVNGSEWATLPDQFINFALIRVHQIFEEAVQYVGMTGFISESSSVKGAKSVDAE